MHPNFPGQFKHLAPAVAMMGNDVRAVTFSDQEADVEWQGVLVSKAQVLRGGYEGIDPWQQDIDVKFIRGRAAYNKISEWKKEGWIPDLVVGHSGWGDMMCLRQLYPRAKIIGWFEFYYGSPEADINFDPEFQPSSESKQRAELKNMWPLWMLQQVDQGVCPTEFQKRTHPEIYHDQLTVIHEGIDTQKCKPNNDVVIRLGANGPLLSRKDKVITFVNRNLEPYRGYHCFMRALPELLERNPGAHAVIVGDEGEGYGAPPPRGQSWKQIFLAEVAERLDPNRVHFLGKVNYNVFIALMQLSTVHIYLTYPFVLSWSLLEAMSCGAPIVASDTAPVREVIRDGENGFLVDFFDYGALVDKVTFVLDNPEAAEALRVQARSDIITYYDLERVCLPAQIDLLGCF